MSKTNDDFLRIGEVSRQAGVSIDTIRFYERLKLIRASARSEAGYRYYMPAVVSRLRFIRQAKAFGFSLEEIGHLLELTEDDNPTNQQVLGIIHQKVCMLDSRISQMKAVRHALQGLLPEGDTVPAGRAPGVARKLRSVIETCDLELDGEDIPRFERRGTGLRVARASTRRKGED